MIAIPAKLYEAFEKIRLGKVEEGTRLFDRIDGFDVPKSVALAELSYFRHDWKRGMSFSLDFLASEIDLETVRYTMTGYKKEHLALIILATCQLESWNECLASLLQIKKEYDKSNMYQQTISLISDPVNTTRRLKESKPKQKMEGTPRQTKSKTYDLDFYLAQVSHAVSRRSHWRQRSYDDWMQDAYRKASTADHIAFYEQYIDRLEDAQSHAVAAKSFIAVENLSKAKEAIRRYMQDWQFKEPFQVAPIVLFTDPELWQVMSDKRFCESLLTIPHNRES